MLMSDVNIAFRQAAHNILLENEALLQHFTLELKTSHDSGRYWKNVTLEYLTYVHMMRPIYCIHESFCSSRGLFAECPCKS